LKKKIKTDVTELQPIELGSDINNAVDVLTKLPDPIPKNTNITSFQHPILIGSQAARYHFPSFQNPIDWNIIATPSQAINWLNSLKTKHKTETKMVYYKNICIKIQLKCTINNVKGIEDIYNYNIEVVIGPHDMKEILNQKSSSIITIPAVAVTPICQSHNPLTGPSRSLDVETMLKSHINEMEKIYGVPNGDFNLAYKLCIDTHSNSPTGSSIYKITKIYCDFLYKTKDGRDMLFYDSKKNTEIDVVIYAFSYIMDLLNQGLEIQEKWLDLTDDQTRATRVPYIQFAGVNGQMLVQCLVNGFYVIHPGLKLQLPTRINQINKLNLAIRIIKCVMDMYNIFNKTVNDLETNHNEFDRIFKNDVNVPIKPMHSLTNYVHDPWWTPKKKKAATEHNSHFM
ncbi:22011_t:CDS:2, partial [Entrophospora sp. SA101]